MNERIKELALEAGIVSKYFSFDQWWEQELTPEQEKFAKLIIQECVKFLEENSGYDECNNAWHPEPEELLNHFGDKS
jgi:hypothetical protein